MSTGLDHFSRGLERAFARKAKEQQAKKNIVHAQEVAPSIANTITTTITNQPVKLTNELYQTTLLTKMRSRLAQLQEESK
ncbi:hypothetical protein F6R97_27265 [Pseudomonas sp. JV414]|uniref:hypothetical protein n=1 Tax=Pseudomonas sp. JV414 TaxID=1733110 RepID=UPI0028E0B325|nr:hypothetical protein [Pseudomonas sp. JV414]MDT9678216.1 hypothetical protein [Pseudomonas sp. JV414]